MVYFYEFVILILSPNVFIIMKLPCVLSGYAPYPRKGRKGTK